jgi:hypothetical protein
MVPQAALAEIRDAMLRVQRRLAAHMAVHVLDSETQAYGLSDSPVGVLAWLLHRWRSWSYSHGGVESVFPRDHMLCTCESPHTRTMRSNKDELPSDVVRWLQSEASSLWPAILGSLGLRRGPCIRENCQACRSGEQHLSGTLKGRRFTLYIPEDLVPEVRRCLDNGRALQELLFEAGPHYIKALKRQRSSSSKKAQS